MIFSSRRYVVEVTAPGFTSTLHGNVSSSRIVVVSGLFPVTQYPCFNINIAGETQFSPSFEYYVPGIWQIIIEEGERFD